MNRSTAARLLATATLLFCSAALAREGVLKTTNGTVYRGDIREEDNRYIVTVDKVETPIDKGIVTSVVYTGTIDEQFDQRIKALDPKDAQGRVTVARFAFDHGRNDLAIQALSGAMQIDPNNPDAIEMLKTVNAQQQLGQTSAAAAATPSAVDSATPAPAAPTSQPTRHLLTIADINTIRQTELRADETVPFNITPEARRQFLADSGMSSFAFGQMPNSEQLAAIISKGSNEVKAGTRLMRDPAALAEFKRSIHPAVLRTCATIGCHAGMSAGSLVLFNGNDDQTVYTNFYIMEQFSQQEKGAGGFFGGATQHKLIDRGNGVHSLLVNFGLPAGQGQFSHPALPNGATASIFHNRETPAYQLFVDWMDRSLKIIEPTYNIKYVIPHGLSPSSQPAGGKSAESKAGPLP